MSEESEKSKIGTRIRKSLTGLFQLFIVLCLLGGFLDIVYPLAISTKNYLTHKVSETWPFRSAEPSLAQNIVLPESGFFSVRQEPGIRNIAAEYHSKNINVAADGLRYNGQDPPEKVSRTGLLLGSSTAFGYGVTDDQTIAAHLENELKDVRLYNYAGIGQPTTDNILRWYDLQKKYGKPDFVILAGVGYQIYVDCQAKQTPAVNSRSNIFVYLANRIADKSTHEKIQPCASSESLDLAIRSSILSIEKAVEFGRKQGVPFHIVYLPTPYDENINIDNLLKTAQAKEHILAMQRVYRRYRQELARLDFPELIDLSNALPSDKMYFLDAGGHLSDEGNKFLADTLFQRIWGNEDPERIRAGQDMKKNYSLGLH
ncbi:SGNH/GDSL hydrolase family protein [Orrella marina]|uniref:Uncharacterized protein n=1 Tax=Orrella marina TaxID=2163011 RepID=A0A2R4XGX4_9BURK|nr:SGNH/GDSL hydrolase family protein [Orrella marina]AWB33055.1 hypothetical protein DBV39_04225 [Orrella marina]